MTVTTLKMGMVVWNQLTDPYDHDQLASNFLKLDLHDHTGGRGVQIPTEGIADGSITTEKIVDSAITSAKLASSLSTGIIPTGSIVDFAGSTAPAGWVLCDGSTYDGTISTYLALWGVISTDYGGTGQPAFKVPDSRGRVLVGAGAGSGLTSRTRATKSGEESHLLSVGEMPAHSHQFTTDAGGTIFVIKSGDSYSVTTASTGSSPVLGFTTGSGVYDGIDPSVLTNVSKGGGGTHNNMQPYLVVNHIIKL